MGGNYIKKLDKNIQVEKEKYYYCSNCETETMCKFYYENRDLISHCTICGKEVIVDED